MIKLNVSAANIAVEEKETLTEGRVGLLCQFRFTDEWAGLAKTAVFDGADSRDVILKWLKTCYRRFFSQQFKRNCLPDGPKVGSVALSPRGDWRMPSDAKWTLWQSELETLE